MAYSEIINEIQEQIDDINLQIEQVNLNILDKQAEIEELELKLPQFQQRIEGLNQLKVNAQALSEESGSSVVVNVTNAFSSSTPVSP